MIKTKQFWIGALVGLSGPPVAFWLYYFARFHNFNQLEAAQLFYASGLSSAILSLSLFANLLLFYLFMWKGKDKHCQGIVFATILYAITGFILKYNH